MHPNGELVESLYRALARRDAATMAAALWSRMAIGPIARVPLLRHALHRSVRRKARASLDAWIAAAR